MPSMSRSPGYVPALGFNWLTPFYDQVVAVTTRERCFKRALIQQAGIGPAHQVLDLASGTGTLAIWIKQTEPAADVTGVDGDPAVLAIARRKVSQTGVTVRFDQALSFNLPYPDGQFDRVVSSLFFHHLIWDNKVSTAHELYRVIKSGGELHIADWGRPANALMRLLFYSIQMLDGFATTGDNAKGRLPDLLRTAGFAGVAETQHFNTIFGTLTLYRAGRP